MSCPPSEVYTHAKKKKKKKSHTPVKGPVVHSLRLSSVTYTEHPNNAACTKSVSLQNVEVGHYAEEDEVDEEEELWGQSKTFVALRVP